MSVKLYVGNLPYSTTNQELEDLFAQVGEVISAQVMTDRDTGRSRGFGFVEMEDDQAANEAIRKYDGKPYQSRPLTVNVARPRVPRGDAGRGGYGGERRRRERY